MSEPIHVSFHVDVQLHDFDFMLAHAETLEQIELKTPQTVLPVAICNPARRPLDHGYEIIDKSTTIDSTNLARTLFHVAVVDPEAVIAEARESYGENWGDQDWSPATLEEALYEILVASNASPSPMDIGFEIVDFHGVSNNPVASTPAPKT